MKIPGWIRRVAISIGSGVAAVAASIVAPSAVITVYAVQSREADAIAAFAGRVAEPLALLGAVAATYGLARALVRSSRRGRELIPWIGGAAAAAVIAAAWWAGDLDIWTAIAAVMVPVAALIGGGRRPESVAPASSPPELSPPAEQLRERVKPSAEPVAGH